MSLDEIVRSERRRIRARVRIALWLVPAAAALALLTSAAVPLGGGGWLRAHPIVPFVAWGAGLATALLLGALLTRRLRDADSARTVARAIEREQGLRRGSLEGVLEVAATPDPLVRQALDQLGLRLSGVATAPAPRHRRRLTQWAIIALFVAVQGSVLVGVSWARRPDGWQALLHPIAAWRGSLLPALWITESPARLLRGAEARVVILAPGRADVRLAWRSVGGAWRDSLLTVGADDRAVARLDGVDADLLLIADDGRSTSDTVRIRVVDRPFVGDVQLRATYPGYLRRVAETLAADAPLRIPVGTQLAIAGHASESLTVVRLRHADRTIALTPKGTAFAGSWSPAASGRWGWEAQGAQAAIEDVPSPLDITVVEDSLPRVEILSPTGEVMVTPTDRLGIEVLAQDDHALRGVWLRRWIVAPDGRPSAVQETRLVDLQEGEWVGTVPLTLSDLSLVPGSALHLVAVARDGAPGDRTALSAPLILKVPSRDEAREAARTGADSAVSAAIAAARAQAQLAEKSAEAARQRSDRPTQTPTPSGASPKPSTPPGGMSFAGAEQARAMAEQQRALQERVKGLEEAARTMEDRLQRAGALDSSLARQLQDAQRMLREAMTPAMAEALRRLEGSAQQLDGERARQSFAELSQQQQRMREALEKSAEMLKRAALEGAMQTLSDQAKELAKAQRDAADSSTSGAADPARAQQLGDRAERLADQISALKDRLKGERASSGAREAERAEAAAERSAAAQEQAQRAAEQARQQGARGDRAAEQRARDAAGRAAEEGAEAMQQAASALEQARKEQVGEWKAQLTDALDRSVQEMLQLAKEQDQLAEQAQRDASDPSLRGQQSALQQGVQRSQERLSEEGKRSALVSPRSQQMMQQAQQKVSQATRESAQGARGQQAQAMQEAADALRQAAAQLTRDRERAAQAQSASGLPEMLQQLQQLAQQQGALNGQMQSLMPSGQGQGQRQQGLDAAGRAQARQLARSQREVARKLDEISDSDPTGRAQELAREARAVAQALDQGAVDPGSLARQERLFRRMLDAGRSLEQEQRDESQRREARAGREDQRFVPPAGSVRGRDASRYAVPSWEELRGLSADERRLVIEYFRRLNAEGRP